MSEKRIPLETSKVHYTFTTNLPEQIRKKIGIDAGEKLGFFWDDSRQLIIIARGGDNLMGGSNITQSYNYILIKEVRKHLQVTSQDKIAYVQEPDGELVSISLVSCCRNQECMKFFIEM